MGTHPQKKRLSLDYMHFAGKIRCNSAGSLLRGVSQNEKDPKEQWMNNKQHGPDYDKLSEVCSQSVLPNLVDLRVTGGVGV